LILLEAKDSVTKLLNQPQLLKSIRMFQAEIRRFRSLIDEHEKGGAAGRYLVLTGFLFPAINRARDLNIFRGAYEVFLRGETGGPDINEYIVLLVERNRSDDLFVSWHVAVGKGSPSKTVQKLSETFPSGLTHFLPR